MAYAIAIEKGSFYIVQEGDKMEGLVQAKDELVKSIIEEANRLNDLAFDIMIGVEDTSTYIVNRH